MKNMKHCCDIKFTVVYACQKLSKLTKVRQSYCQNKIMQFFTHMVEMGKNINYLGSVLFEF